MRHDDAERLATELYAALAAGQADRLSGLLHPEFVGRTAEGLPFGLGGTYGSPEAMQREFWWRIGRSYVARAQPREFGMLDDGRLVVFGRYTGNARDGGGALDAEFVHVLSFSDGKIVRLEQLTDTARWRDALEGGGDEPKTIELAVEDGLARVRLNRPAARNGIDEAFVADLYEVVQRCAARTDLRAMLITGEGAAFCVGGDIALFSGTDPARFPELLRRMTTQYHAALRLLVDLDVPVVTAVHGSVAGGGLGLLYCADVALAAEGTMFATGFAKLGLSGDGANSWFLPRLIGLRRAQQLYFSNRVLDAAEAAELGLVTEVVPADRLAERALAAAQSLAAGPTRAYAEIRKLLRESWTTSLPEHYCRETDALARTAATEDAAAAVRAFIAKTEPKFEGR